MKTRILSAVVLAPLLILLLVLGGGWLKATVMLLSMVGMFEFYRAMDRPFRPLHLVGYLCGVIYLIGIECFIYTPGWFPILISVFLVVLLAAMVAFHHTVHIRDILVTFFGFFYVCFLLSHIYLVREYTHGQFFLWLIFICAFGCDTGAYFTGMRFGKHKLIEDLSPKKTVEGAVGGVVTATVVALLFGLAVENIFSLTGVNTVLLCVCTGVVGSILSQFGDLAASSIKRSCGIKDYSHIIPGHGGVLDRFDSVLFTAPTVYYIMIALIGVQ